MANIRDIARLAGVSPATVSLAMHGDPRVAAATAQRIRQIAKEQHYTASLTARSLRMQRNGVIGLAVYKTDQPYPAKMASLLAEEVKRRGAEAIMQQTGGLTTDDLLTLRRVINQLCDGMILNSTMLSKDRLSDLDILDAGKPIVLLDDARSQLPFDTVGFSCSGQAELAMSHLFAVGCRKVLVLGTDYLPISACTDRTVSAWRVLGCHQAAMAQGLTLGPEHFAQCEWNYQSAYETMLRLLSQTDAGAPRFDGIMCMADSVGIGALRALRERGVDVPGQVAVIGIDGIAESAFSEPGLTTVATDMGAQARTAVDLLLERINEPAQEFTPKHVSVGYELVLRGSTARGTRQ